MIMPVSGPIAASTALRSVSGIWSKPSTLGPKPSRYLAWPPAAIVASVRPWNAPSKVSVRKRSGWPSTEWRRRAILIAASLASAPELAKKTRSAKVASSEALGRSARPRGSDRGSKRATASSPDSSALRRDEDGRGRPRSRRCRRRNRDSALRSSKRASSPRLARKRPWPGRKSEPWRKSRRRGSPSTPCDVSRNWPPEIGLRSAEIKTPPRWGGCRVRSPTIAEGARCGQIARWSALRTRRSGA